MDAKYILEKYKGPASRHTCPNCHHKREFTRYVDSATGRYLSDKVGICNRRDKCGYHYTPSAYAADNGRCFGATSYVHAPKHHSQKPIDAIDRKWLDESLGTGSNFVKWLRSLFPQDVFEPILERLMEDYHFGTTRDGSVIFWQIDIADRIRAGKIMQYDPTTGRRIKGLRAIQWVHSLLKRSGRLPATFNLGQCLFGEHLLSKYPDATVALMESYKSALVGACVMPEMLWCSTDNKQGFTVERCRALAGRDVVAFPDLGAYDLWFEQAKTVSQEVGCRITVSALLERIATPEQRNEGLDIADYITARLYDGIPALSIHDRIAEEEQAAFDFLLNKNPLLTDLVRKLDLVSDRTGKPFNLPSP